MAVVDNAVYVDGARAHDPKDLDETFDLMRHHSGMAWIGLYRPDDAELEAVAAEFGLHNLAVEDALSGHQRSKLERYGDTLFCVLRPARYLDATEEVEFGELHVFVGPSFVVTVRHAESPDLARVRHRLEASADLLALGPVAVLYAILDQVVDEYAPVVAGLENDIDEIEDQLFRDGEDTLSKRIYDLSREVITFQRAVQPLTGVVEEFLHRLALDSADVELQRSLRDVSDHVIRIIERVNSYRALLDNALRVHSTIVTRRLTETSIVQNEQVKKISSWAAILFAPTLVGTVYGMNFDHMPELHWLFGYPYALTLMISTSVVLYTVFRSRRWL